MATDFRVGDWIVRPQRGCIELRDASVHVSPKSMAVLEQLADADGAVVSRDDLLDAVWPHADVTDDVLTHSVSELRKAFGDSPQDPAVIETIPKKGFRLILAVRRLDESEGDATAAHGASDRPFLRLGVALVTVVVVVAAAWFSLSEREGAEPSAASAVPKTITVFPLEDLSEARDQQHLAVGIAEELSRRFSQVDGLDVYGPLEWRVADGSGPIDLSAPGTGFLLTGSVRRSGDSLRISPVLSDRYDGRIVWQHTFERRFADVFEIEDEITDAVVQSLQVVLDVGEESARTGGTSDPDAYEALLKGDSHFRFTTLDLEQAIRWYTRAAAIDSDYAIAWARIALYHNHVWVVQGRSNLDEARGAAQGAVERALELAPDSRDVLEAAASTAFVDRDWALARDYFERATRLSDADRVGDVRPDISLVVYVDMLLKLGYVDEYVSRLEGLNRLRPLTGEYIVWLAQGYHASGRLEEALALLDATYARPRGRYFICQTAISVALSLGDEDRLRQWLDRTLNECGADANSYTANIFRRIDDRDAAIDWLGQAFDRSPSGDYFVAQWALYFGDEELALRALDRSRDLWLFWIPSMAQIRRSEDFRTIVEDMGLVDYWREYGWNDHCHPVGEHDFDCR